MPGRGRPWKGVGEGNPDRIGTGAIADGSITEADLDTSVTSKLNSTGHAIQDEGTPLTQQSKMNFVGAGVTASVGGEDTTIVTIAGGGGGVARDEIGDPFVDFWFYDEFFYPDFAGADDQFPHLEVSANGKSVPTGVGGVVQIQTSTVANNLARINTCGAGLVAVTATKKFRVVWRIKKGTATTEATVAGLTANQNEPRGTFPFATKPFPLIVFFDLGTGNYRAYTDDGTTITNFDTLVPVDTAFHTFEISFDGVTTLLFKIDGATVQTQTINIPTGNLAVMTECQTSEAVAKALQVDSLFIFNER
jgi:hypothetical protein